MRPIEQFYDPEKGMFLPDRFIKGECPKCGAKDQYGDNCEVCGAVYAPTELKNPYSALSGATPVLKTSEHFFFKLSDPRCVEFLEQWTQTPGRLQTEVLNKIREWFATDDEGHVGLADWLTRHGSVLRHFDPYLQEGLLRAFGEDGICFVGNATPAGLARRPEGLELATALEHAHTHGIGASKEGQ